MKIARIVIACLLIGISLPAISHAECNDTNAFLEAVNSAWVASNYTLLEQVLTNRVAECTNDILAKGLVFKFYEDICIDFYKARAAATEFILAVSNRVPDEVIHRRIPMGLPLLLCEMPIPTNFPADQSKTPEQMQFLHNEFPDAFPFLRIYKALMYRMEAVENGLVPDGYFEPLNIEHRDDP